MNRHQKKKGGIPRFGLNVRRGGEREREMCEKNNICGWGVYGSKGATGKHSQKGEKDDTKLHGTWLMTMEAWEESWGF